MATCDMEWISENEMLSTERNVSVHVMRSTCTVQSTYMYMYIPYLYIYMYPTYMYYIYSVSLKFYSHLVTVPGHVV